MFIDLTGRLHPVLIHLPIGILLLAACFELLSGTRRFAAIRPAVPVILFWGMISAIAACISGLALEAGGEYEEEVTNPHKWSGIALAVISIISYFLYKRKVNPRIIKLSSILLLTMLFVTGHLGGSITHGEDFITAGLFDEGSSEIKMKPIPDIQEAYLYNDVVQPLLQSRCYNCHGPKKQKGKLRLDQQDLIIKGGESGHTIMGGKPEESEMIERLLLPEDHDDHMPPKGKPQLSREQIEILEWWVSTGADFHKKVAELKQTEDIKPVLLALQTGISSEEIVLSDLPETPAPAADTSAIRKLNDAGIIVVPVSRESNYLTANFITGNGSTNENLDLLLTLKKQLISLKIDGRELNDSSMKKISALTSLRRLQLSNSTINDKSVTLLSPLVELRYLNLTGTSVTANGLAGLKNLKNLKNIYLYKTSIDASERDGLKKVFASANLDFGNYSLPMLSTDTVEVEY